MKTSYPKQACGLVLLALVALSTSCSLIPDGDSAPTYRLTPAELAWQGYQPGQELRFGRAGTTKIRTFRVLEVQDKLETHANNGALVSGHETYQTITVLGQRTDSVSYNLRSKTDSIPAIDTLLKLYKYPGSSTSGADTRAEIEWAYTLRHTLPLADATAGQPSQDLAVDLLPQVVLGGITYGPTLRVTSSLTANNFSYNRGLRVVRRVYYAQGKGVVGYEEEGTGLWYRLP